MKILLQIRETMEVAQSDHKMLNFDETLDVIEHVAFALEAGDN